MTDVQRLRELAAKATPGPWRRPNREQWPTWAVALNEERRFVYANHEDNAAYIAAVSPDVVTGLLDRLDALEQATKRFVVARDAYNRCDDPVDGEPCAHWYDQRDAFDALRAVLQDADICGAG